VTSAIAAATANTHRGANRLILGIVLAVITFWLFAQTTLNVAPTMREELRISESLNNIAVSITALFSGIFIVVAGDLADRLGRLKLTYVGLALSVLGSLLIALSPAGTIIFLMTGRIIQGLSAACAVLFFRAESGNPDGFVDLRLFNNKTYAGATLSNFLLNGAAGTLLVALSLVQQGAGLSSLQSGLLTIGYLVAILSTIRVGERLLQRRGARKPMLMGCVITATGILLTTFTFLLVGQYMIVAFFGFTLFGVGLGFYATPSTDAALSNVPNDKAGAASGIYKMASSLGAAFGVAISAALFTSLSGLNSIFTPLSDLFLGRTDNVGIRFAAAIALLFNVIMVIIAIVAIAMTVPKDDLRGR
jgi:MFS transporter, DHA2 family, multidrug resistance protein